ncbi:MAG TPA: phage holin family protein [Candidatus Acidoferrum sp.]|nr:phage holin family protein [Candidatus Acidoferrum sp.]
MKSFLKRWIITTLAVLVTIRIVPGITYDSWTGLLVATLLLGLLNAVVRPVLIFFALPLVILTLGLFIFPINALLLWWVGHLKDFHVASFWSALWASVIISVVTMVLNSLTGSSKAEVRFHRVRPPPPPADDGGGPVIDV